MICVTAAPTPSYVGRRSSYTLLRRCTAGVNRAALTSHARHTTQRGQCWVTRTSTSTGGRWRADARRAASPSGFRDAPRTSAAAAGDGDGGRVDGAAGRASEEGAGGAAEQCAPQDGGGGCKASATVRLVCTGWMSRHDALVMRLLLRQDATDEGAGVLVRRFPAVAGTSCPTA